MIVLKNQTLTAHILPRGATLCGLWFKDDPCSLVLGSSEPSVYATDLEYSGAVVGPVANRISDGRLTINGQHFQMERNEPPNSLHSGTQGLHARDWRIVSLTKKKVVLATDLHNGQSGLPGKRAITATYELATAGVLTVTMTATTDQTTVMNLAHHPYWNLDGSDHVGSHTLHILADKYLPVDASNIPSGEIVSVEGSDYDFRAPSLIPTNVSLDANLCLAQVQRANLQEAAHLSGVSGRCLRISTTEPGLQVYNGSGLKASGTILHNGVSLKPFAGVALEPQGWPDAPNRPDFPSITISPDAPYVQITEYHIS